MKVWVTPKFIDAHGKASTLYPDEVAVPEGSTLSALVDSASKQLKGIIPPETNRVIVKKYAAQTLKTFVPVLAVRISEAACEDGTQYEVQFLRPQDRLERHEEEKYYAYGLSALDTPPIGARKRHRHEPAEQLTENAKQPKVEREEPPDNAVDSLTDSDVSSFLRKVEQDRDDRCDSTVDESTHANVADSIEADGPVDSTATQQACEGPVDPCLRSRRQTLHKEPKHEPRAPSAIAPTIHQVKPTSLIAESDDENHCDTPSANVIDNTHPAAEGDTPQNLANDTVSAEFAEDAPPSARVVTLDNQATGQPTGMNVGATASFAKALALKLLVPYADDAQKIDDPVTGKDIIRTASMQDSRPSESAMAVDDDNIEQATTKNVVDAASSVTSRSSTKEADGLKVSNPVPANEAHLRDFMLRISDIIKTRFEPHSSQLKPDLEDYKQFILKLVMQVTEKELKTCNALKVTDSVTRATKRYVDDWIEVLRNAERATSSGRGTAAAPRYTKASSGMANREKQSRILRRCEFSSGSRTRAGASPIRRSTDRRRSAERKPKTDTTIRTRSKNVVKPRHSSSSRRESDRSSCRVLKQAPTRAISKKSATRSVALNLSKNSPASPARAKTPPRRNSARGFTTWQDDYSTLFTPHIVPSDRGNAYYNCKLCNLDFLFGKQGSATIERHLLSWKHVSLAAKDGSRKTVELEW